ncbi:TniQ family protein [Thiomicrorhabdus sp. Kp2]|uniref:TniQ family protein n=1 Tax=Thiomicrorhabdus sp. Kp2 TaxID=1123518 RepID=UPI00041F0BDE|nr:TniQ family protein [Thiomicrorhabdus sp. Kp2]
MKRLWPIVLPIKEDELLSSWIIRNSLANGSDPMTWSWFFWGKWRPWTIDIDRHCPKEKLLAISDNFFRIESLEQATLKPTILKVLGEQPPLKQAWPWLTRLGSRNRERTGGLRFCPECLKEDPVYFRKSWRLSWYHTCPKHDVLLQESCPSCSSPITPYKSDFDKPELHICKRCGFDVSLTKTECSSKKILQVQHLLNKAILNNNCHLPWNIESIAELFSTIRYFYEFFNLAAKGAINADLALCNKLDIDTSLRPTAITIENIDKSPPIWIRELDFAVSQLLFLSTREIVELFLECEMTGEGFRKSKESQPPIIQNILSSLPSNSRHRKSSSRTTKEVKPKSREEVWEMWLQLQEYLK